MREECKETTETLKEYLKPEQLFKLECAYMTKKDKMGGKLIVDEFTATFTPRM